jgi:iron complex transport system substrate-binding protein
MYRTSMWAAVVAAIAIAIAFVAIRSANRSDSREPAAAPESAAFPVTVEHKFGTTEVPAAPERVVTVGYTESDTLLALGVEPVGVREFLGGYGWRERPWAQDALGGEAETAVSAEEINFEAVAAQRPDLIVGINSGMTEGDYDRLSRIAPTIAQSGDFVDFGMPWQDQVEMIGRALGRDDGARRTVDEVQARFEAVRREHPEFEGATAILAYGGPDGYGAYASQDTRSRFFSDLGFKTPPRVDELAGDGFYTEFSQEQFRLMDQDVVIMFGTQADVLANPVFRRLDAVRDDRVVYLDLGDQFSGALGYASPLSLPFLLDEAAPRLAAAVDGDPATKVEQPR